MMLLNKFLCVLHMLVLLKCIGGLKLGDPGVVERLQEGWGEQSEDNMVWLICDEFWFYTDGVCKPVCFSGCPGAECLRPGVCGCVEGFKPTNSTNEGCVPICDPPCKNDMLCIAPNQCECPNDYIKENDKCIPKCNYVCSEGCSALNACLCLDGYKTNALDKYVCDPICDEECANATCTAPGVCTPNAPTSKLVCGSNNECAPNNEQITQAYNDSNEETIPSTPSGKPIINIFLNYNNRDVRLNTSHYLQAMDTNNTNPDKLSNQDSYAYNPNEPSSPDYPNLNQTGTNPAYQGEWNNSLLNDSNSGNPYISNQYYPTIYIYYPYVYPYPNATSLGQEFSQGLFSTNFTQVSNKELPLCSQSCINGVFVDGEECLCNPEDDLGNTDTTETGGFMPDADEVSPDVRGYIPNLEEQQPPYIPFGPNYPHGQQTMNIYLNYNQRDQLSPNYPDSDGINRTNTYPGYNYYPQNYNSNQNHPTFPSNNTSEQNINNSFVPGYPSITNDYYPSVYVYYPNYYPNDTLSGSEEWKQGNHNLYPNVSQIFESDGLPMCLGPCIDGLSDDDRCICNAEYEFNNTYSTGTRFGATDISRYPPNVYSQIGPFNQTYDPELTPQSSHLYQDVDSNNFMNRTNFTNDVNNSQSGHPYISNQFYPKIFIYFPYLSPYQPNGTSADKESNQRVYKVDLSIDKVLSNDGQVPVCSEPCVNGVCVEGNRCSCNAGYIPDDTYANTCRPA